MKDIRREKITSSNTKIYTCNERFMHTNKLRIERYTTEKDYFLRKIISLAVCLLKKQSILTSIINTT